MKRTIIKSKLHLVKGGDVGIRYTCKVMGSRFIYMMMKEKGFLNINRKIKFI